MLDFQAFPYENKKPKLIQFCRKGNKNYSTNPMKLLIERINSTVPFGWEKSMSKPLPILPALPECTQKRLQVTPKEKCTT